MYMETEDANYLSSVVVRASVKCRHQCLRLIIMNIILSKVIYKHCYLMQHGLVLFFIFDCTLVCVRPILKQ